MSTILGIPDATMDIPKPTTGKLIIVMQSNPTSSVILDKFSLLHICNFVYINSNGRQFDYNEFRK